MKKELVNRFYLLSLIISLFFYCDISAYSKNYTAEERDLILQLYDIGVLRFDTATMNPPLSSPYYIDLRHTISHPHIFKKIINLLVKKSKELSYDIICGVPYAALAMAATVAYDQEKPLIMRRAHVKNYGTAKKIEGIAMARSVVEAGTAMKLLDQFIQVSNKPA